MAIVNSYASLPEGIQHIGIITSRGFPMGIIFEVFPSLGHSSDIGRIFAEESLEKILVDWIDWILIGMI